jgi:CRP-like cAMP-binding protein
VRLSKNSKAAAIARVPVFARCSKAELGRIAQLADEVDMPAGRALTKEGARGREFMVLLEGEADVMRQGRRIATMRGGDFFGEIALVTEVPRTATVTTTTPSRLLVITDRAFRQLMRDSPEIQEKVLEAVAARLAALI